jgi:hypothetical protein
MKLLQLIRELEIVYYKVGDVPVLIDKDGDCGLDSFKNHSINKVKLDNREFASTRLENNNLDVELIKELFPNFDPDDINFGNLDVVIIKIGEDLSPY